MDLNPICKFNKQRRTQQVKAFGRKNGFSASITV